MGDLRVSITLRSRFSHLLYFFHFNGPRSTTDLADDVVVVILIDTTMTKEFLSLGGELMKIWLTLKL